MYKNGLISALLLFLFSSIVFAEDKNWVIRISDGDGNVKKEFTVDGYKSEVSNFAVLQGVPFEALAGFITNDIERWQFASQLIEQELIYLKAIDEGYDKDGDILEKAKIERDRQIAQLYAQETLSPDILKISDAEKRDFFNKNKSRIQSVSGANVTFDQVARDIEYAIAQEKMRLEYERIVKEAQKKYKMTFSSTKDPCIVIEDKKVPLALFNDMFNQSIQQAGANIPAAIRVQARESMFNAFVAREVMTYEAEKSGFYDTPQAKSLDNFIMRSAIIANYLDKAIRAKLPEPTKEEINAAYSQYGKLYNIDALPYSEAQKALKTIVNEAKFQNQYKILVTDLRYKDSIEKKLKLLDGK